MTQRLTPAQQAQTENRDATGQWKTKPHRQVDDTGDILGAEFLINRGEYTKAAAMGPGSALEQMCQKAQRAKAQRDPG